MIAIKGALKGVSQMKQKLRFIADAYPDRIKAALYQEAQIEMTESKRRCPVDVTPPTPHPGLLRSTGRVHEPVREGRKISVELSYGTEYAIYVHEVLDAHHEVGQAKFLESVINESRPFMAARLAARLKLGDK